MKLLTFLNIPNYWRDTNTSKISFLKFLHSLFPTKAATENEHSGLMLVRK